MAEQAEHSLPPPPPPREQPADQAPQTTSTAEQENVQQSTTEADPALWEAQSEEMKEIQHGHNVFALLMAHPETQPTPQPQSKQDKPEWVRVQEKAFTKWTNSHLECHGKPPITNLVEDMKDGLVLITLLESLTNKVVGVKYHKEPKTHIQRMDNLQVAFNFMENEGIEHTSMNPTDIANGNLKLLLGILWRFIFKYHISAPLKTHNVSASRRAPSQLTSDGEATQAEKMTPEQILLSWFQASLPQFQISNFTSDWNDGIKLSALVNYCKPGLIPNWSQKDPAKALENIQNAIDIAQEHLGIPEIIHAEDLAVDRPDKLSVMTYLTYFCCPGSPGEKALMEWIGTVLPETRITDFTSHWKDGHALCTLVATFAPSAISLDDLDNHNDLENTRTGMETAEQQFGIKPLISPEQFVSPDINQLSVMAYLTQFRFIQEERRKLPYLSAIGPGITGTQVGGEAELQIEGEELDESFVEVRVTSPDSSIVRVEEIPKRAGTPAFQYRPTIPGTYTVAIKYSGEHIRGSPYQVNHSDTLDSVTDGRGLYRACVGKEAEFTVDCSTLGEGLLSVRIMNPDNDTLEIVMNKEQEGTYSIRYTPLVIGEHTIELEWDCRPESEDSDEPVTTLKSSYTATVFDASKCVVTGDGLSHAFIGEPAYFQVKTSGAGKGSLSAYVIGPGNPEVTLISIVDDEYSYEYIPGEGYYLFELKWENVPIPGSPFKVTPIMKTPAAQCIVKERPVDNIRVCTPVSVIVSTADAEVCELKARLTGANTDKECNIAQIETNIHAITFCPIEIGEYDMHITYGGNPIPESPLHFNVNDPTKCQVVNPDALVGGSWQCGQQVLVRVSTLHAGKGTLVGKVQGPSQSIACKTVEEEGGNRLVCFTPTETGQHTIDLFFDGHHFKDESNKITVEDDSLEGIAITKPVSQTGYHLANKMLDIRMFAPGRDEKLFTVEATGSQTGAIPTCMLEPTGEDTYIIHFTASEPDDYRVSISYNGKPIPGSPFTLAIRVPPCPENVVSFDPVLPLKAGENPIELFFKVTQAGVGTLTANVTDSSSDDWFQLVNIEEVYEDLYCVSFVPPKSDTYTINVFWSGQHIPGSPLTIPYREQLKEPPVCIEFEPELSLQGRISATAVGTTSGKVSTEARQYVRGHYQISFTPPQSDVFNLHMLCFDKEISGSPFKVDLSPSPPARLPEGVRVVSLPITVNRPGFFSAFAVGKKVGLVQPLKVTLSQKKDFVHIDFTDRRRDSYELYIFWNQQLLPGSPFKIDLSA